MTGATTFLSVGEVDYFPPLYGDNPEQTYFGTAQRVFKIAASGSVQFDYASAIVPIGTAQPTLPAVSFSNYSATVTKTPLRLKVSFTLTIGKCSVAFTGAYHGSESLRFFGRRRRQIFS